MFKDIIHKALKESVVDWDRKTLDPKIFAHVNGEYQLKPNVAQKIKEIVKHIDEHIVPVNDYFIKGSILSKQWLETSDIDILIETNKLTDDEWEVAQNLVKEKFNETNLLNTKHPIQIYIQGGKYNRDNADGIYHLEKGWIKGPYDHRVNINKYIDQFKKSVKSLDLQSGELKRDIIDYELIKSLDEDEIKELKGEIDSKLNEINLSVEKLVGKYKNIRRARHGAFNNNMKPKELIEYGTKNALPENVIFKMLERYHYIDFLKFLNTAYEDKKIVDSEIDTLKDKLSKI